MVKKLSVALVALLVLHALPDTAFAQAYCPKKNVTFVFSGDNGDIYIGLKDGGEFKLPDSNPNKNASAAIALTAVANGYEVEVRVDKTPSWATPTNCNNRLETVAATVTGVYIWGPP